MERIPNIDMPVDSMLVEARRLGAQGVHLIAEKQIEEGFRCFAQAYEIATEIGDPALQSDLLGSMGMVYLDTGDPAIALEKVNAALQIAGEIADPEREMVHLGNLGNIYLHIAAAEEAERFFTQALTLSQKLGDQQAEAGYLTNLATIDKTARRNEKAAKSFETVRKLTRELGDHPGERNALRHLIHIYSDKSAKQDLVLTYLHRAITLSHQLQDYHAEAAYQDALILALLSLNRYRESLHLIDKLLQDDALPEYSERRMHLLVNRGNACFDDEKIDAADAAYEMALEIAIRQQNWQVEARMRGRLGAIAAERGHLDKAIAYAQQALEKATRIEDDRLIGEQYCMLALANRDLGNRSEAIVCCEKAIGHLNETAIHSLQEKAQQLLEELQREPGA